MVRVFVFGCSEGKDTQAGYWGGYPYTKHLRTLDSRTPRVVGRIPDELKRIRIPETTKNGRGAFPPTQTRALL